jgi:hypothetical protein
MFDECKAEPAKTAQKKVEKKDRKKKFSTAKNR